MSSKSNKFFRQYCHHSIVKSKSFQWITDFILSVWLMMNCNQFKINEKNSMQSLIFKDLHLSLDINFLKDVSENSPPTAESVPTATRSATKHQRVTSPTEFGCFGRRSANPASQLPRRRNSSSNYSLWPAFFNQRRPEFGVPIRPWCNPVRVWRHPLSTHSSPQNLNKKKGSTTSRFCLYWWIYRIEESSGRNVLLLWATIRNRR